MDLVTYLWWEGSKLKQGQIPTLRRNPNQPGSPRGSGITHLQKAISQDPGYSSLKIATLHKRTPPAQKYQITANGKEGRRGENKHLNQFSIIRPGTYVQKNTDAQYLY